MTFGDFKLYSINTFALGVTTFTKIEMGLKILLLVVLTSFFMGCKEDQIAKDKTAKQILGNPEYLAMSY